MPWGSLRPSLPRNINSAGQSVARSSTTSSSTSALTSNSASGRTVNCFRLPVGFPGTLVLTRLNKSPRFLYCRAKGYLQTNDAWAGLGRLDWNIANNHRFNIRFSASKNNALNAASRAKLLLTLRQGRHYLQTELSRTRPRLALRNWLATLARTLLTNCVCSGPARTGRVCRIPRYRKSLPALPLMGGRADTSSFLPNAEYDTRHQVADSLTYLTGNHNFKFGGEYSRIFATQTFGFSQFGQYNLSLAAPPNRYRTLS